MSERNKNSVRARRAAEVAILAKYAEEFLTLHNTEREKLGLEPVSDFQRTVSRVAYLERKVRLLEEELAQKAETNGND